MTSSPAIGITPFCEYMPWLSPNGMLTTSGSSPAASATSVPTTRGVVLLAATSSWIVKRRSSPRVAKRDRAALRTVAHLRVPHGGRCLQAPRRDFSLVEVLLTGGAIVDFHLHEGERLCVKERDVD